MFAVNKLLSHKIPAEKIIDFEEAYKEIVEEGKSEVETRMRMVYQKK